MESMEKVEKRFLGDVSNHVMIVFQDQGVYRHLRFKQPGTIMYYFDIVTWPGHLAITGDMGEYVFSRLDDMFQFFRGKNVNVSYWSEKCRAVDRDSRLEEWDKDLFIDWIDEMVQNMLNDEMWSDPDKSLEEFAEAVTELRDSAGYKDSAHEAIQSFYNAGWIRDYPDRDFTSPSYHLLWVLHAIKYAIEAYDKMKGESDAE